MTNLEKLLHDSDNADMELSKKIDNIEKAIEEQKAITDPITNLANTTDDYNNGAVNPNRVFGMNSKGARITAGTDLNDITERGTYYCESYSIVTTLLNTPQKLHGFRLEVVSTTANSGNNFIQRMFVNNSDQSTQYYRFGTGTWYKFTGTAVSS